MTDKKSNDSRRKLLKSIAAGSGTVVAGKSLPESWSKPVINAIVLPAHAALTDGSENLPGEGTTTTTTTVEACNIAGEYCWIQNIFFTTFNVGADGSIMIIRTHLNNGREWHGNGTASNGAMGGTFDIDVIRTDKSSSIRNYQGTIVCEETSIGGEYTKDQVVKQYTATQDDCIGGE